MARRTPPTRRRRGDDPTFPVIPIAIGVVLVGFAIGAAIPALRGGGTNPKRALPAVTATPTALPPPADTALPPPRIRASATPAATARPTPAPSVTPQPTASPKATPQPTASPKATPQPTASPKATPQPSPTATSAATPVAVSSPRPHTPSPVVQSVPKPTARAVAHVTPRPHPAPVETEASAQSDMESLASAAVRRYLNAIIAGDSSAARAVLDVPAGSDQASLSEESFLDPDSRILDVRAHASTGDAAQVEADLQSSTKGSYFAHFSVKKTDKGVMIVEHDSIKP